MSQPITDKAEVSIDFPDKFYMGSFGHGSRFDVAADEEGIHLYLDRRTGEKRHVGFHVHYYLLGDMLAALGEAIDKVEKLSPEHAMHLRTALATWQLPQADA